MKKLQNATLKGRIKTVLLNVLFLGTVTTANAQWSNLSSGITNNLYGVHFPTRTIGYAVGNKGAILKTLDTGNTWTMTTLPCTDCWYWDVRFTNKDTGYIVGETDPGTNPHGAGVIFKTLNGGATWTNVLYDVKAPVRDLFLVNKDTLYACGGAEHTYGKVWKSVDNGSTWTLLSSTYYDAMLGGLCFFDSKVGFLGVYESVFGTIHPTATTWLNTNDGGASFGTTPLTSSASISNWVFTSDIASSSIAYMSRGTYVGIDSVFIRKTTDAGKTWTEKAIPGFTGSLYGMDFIDADTGYMVGWTGLYGSTKPTIRKTTDGGKTWFAQTSPTTKELNAVNFVDANLGFAVGKEGTIIKYAAPKQQGSGLNEILSDNNKIRVYPNPATSELTIDYPIDWKEVNVKIVNLLGVQLDAYYNFRSHKLNVSVLPSGAYIVQLSNEEGVYETNFIKY